MILWGTSRHTRVGSRFRAFRHRVVRPPCAASHVHLYYSLIRRPRQDMSWQFLEGIGDGRLSAAPENYCHTDDQRFRATALELGRRFRNMPAGRVQFSTLFRTARGLRAGPLVGANRLVGASTPPSRTRCHGLSSDESGSPLGYEGNRGRKGYGGGAWRSPTAPPRRCCCCRRKRRRSRAPSSRLSARASGPERGSRPSAAR